MSDEKKTIDENNIHETNGNQKKDQNEGTGLALGMCMGLCLGMAIGQLVFNNLVLGMSTGMCLGMCLGLIYDERKKKENAGEKNAAHAEEVRKDRETE